MSLNLLFIGEKIGVEYLYSQTGKQWHSDLHLDPDEPDDLTEDLGENSQVDEGFEELPTGDDDPTVSLDVLSSSEDDSQDVQSNNEALPESIGMKYIYN